MQIDGTIYGYARVSTEGQDLTAQLDQLKAAGCAPIFREKITGTHAERPRLKKLLASLEPGDVVIVPAVDRLSRDTTDLLVIARDIQKAGAGLRSLAEPVLDTTGDFAELVLAMLGVAAKLERRRIVDRTAVGRANAKARGIKFGRKPKLNEHQRREALARKATGRETCKAIGRSYGVSGATISRIKMQKLGKKVLTEEEQKTAMDKAYKEFMLARAEAINSFARLENYMCMLFCLLVSGNNEPRANVKATELFSEIINTRARVSMIKSLFSIRYVNKHYMFFDQLISKIEKVSNERNKIVHWILVTTQTGGQTANPSRDIYLAEHPDMFKKGKLYVGDVNYFIRKTNFLGLLTFYFFTLLESHHPLARRGNRQKTPWDQIFQEKIVYPPTENHQLFESYNSWKPMRFIDVHTETVV